MKNFVNAIARFGFGLGRPSKAANTLLREYQRLGLARRLLGCVARRFLSQGIDTMVLFGTPQNPSCAFHEALGGEKLLAKNGEFHGGYGWRDLHSLANRCPADAIAGVTQQA
jgi:FR47-like protein